MNRVGISVIAVLIAGGAGYWAYATKADRGFATSTGVSEGIGDQMRGEQGTSSPKSGTTSVAHRSQVAGSVFQQVSDSIAAAKNGDPAAARIVYQGYEACWQYAMNPNGFLSADQASDPNPQIRNMQTARVQLVKKCHGFEGQRIGLKAIAEMRQIAAAGGDLTALAEIATREAVRGKIDPNEIKSIAESAIAKHDGSAMAALSTIMGSLTEPYIDQLAPLPAGGNLSQAAWMIAACDAGYDCSASGINAQSMCAYGGLNCQLTDIPTFYMQQILSAAEVEQLQKEIGKIKQGQI